MKCEEFDRLLQSYLDGELAGDGAEAARRHSEACPRCAVELRRAAEELAALVGSFAGPAATSRVAAGVASRLGAAGPASAGPPRVLSGSRFRRGLAAVTALAGVAAAVLLATRPTLNPHSLPSVLPSVCRQPGALAIASGLCALPGKGCAFEGPPSGSPECRPCRLSLASCATKFAADEMEEFEVSGTGKADIWFFHGGEPGRELPTLLSTLAASGARGVVLVREGVVRVANGLGAVESSGSGQVALFRGAAPHAF